RRAGARLANGEAGEGDRHNGEETKSCTEDAFHVEWTPWNNEAGNGSAGDRGGARLCGESRGRLPPSHTLSVPQGSAPPYAPRAYAGQAFSTSYRYVFRGVPDCVRPSWPIPWRGGSRYDTGTGTDACQKSVT